MNIGIWPMGIVFEKGEGLRLQVSGKTLVLPEWDNPHVKNQEPLFSKGIHNIYLGGSTQRAISWSRNYDLDTESIEQLNSVNSNLVVP